MISDDALSGRVAVVTGGGGGLGRAICRGLAAAGASVAVVDRDSSRANSVAAALADEGQHAIGVQADVAKRTSVESMARAVLDEFGRVDVLVNNAGIYPRRAWTEISEDDWDEVLAVNVKGCFLCARAFCPSMTERGWGRVINLASLTFFLGFEALLDYVSSKGAVVGFTRALARELGRDGITVNAISPGAFPTDAELIHPDLESYERYVLDQQAIKRRGRPEDVAGLATFLASDAASFITGQTIGLNGGWMMH